MFSNRLYTPLRYPGGKARFAAFIASLMQLNGLEGGHYAEPYAGGAGVALDLLYSGVASHVHINDYDEAVHAFWESATRHPEELMRLVRDTPVTMDQWYHWRSMLRGERQGSLVERGFATLFLNRTNRSGILKAGVIGGKAQDGAYRLDARYKTAQILERLERIARHANRILVYREDASAFLKRCANQLPSRSLIYLDPPYYVKGQELYRNYYEHEDHVRIAELICSARFPHSWVVSYDAVDEIQQMYRLARSVRYGLHYTAQSRYVGSEIMFFSRDLDLGDFRVELPLDAAA